MKYLGFLCLGFISLSALANSQVGRIVKIESEASIYVPGEVKEADTKHVKYLDHVYHIVSAKLGMKMENGYIITTGPSSKVKIIFNNGDHFYVSPNTQYKIDWSRVKGKVEDKEVSVLTLMRGAVRGLIVKKGPRSGMTINTKAVTFGIRGTDFYVSQGSADDTQISVLRGSIEVEDKSKKSVEIKTGQTFIVDKQSSNLSIATKQELKAIAEESKVSASVASTDPVVTEELKTLETMATKETMNDIKEYQPELYKKIEGSQLSSDTLALNTIDKLAETAPVKKTKPKLDDGDEKDPYDKYFKPKK